MTQADGVVLVEGFVRLALEKADAEVELLCDFEILVVLGEGPDEGAVVGA